MTRLSLCTFYTLFLNHRVLLCLSHCIILLVMLNFGHLVKGKLLFFLIDKYLWRDMLRVCYCLLLKLLPTAFSIHWWDLTWKNDYCGVCLMVTFYFLHSIYICSLEKLSHLHVFIYSLIYTNMVVWTYYSVGYNLVPWLFILWLKLFWLLGIPSSWFLCPFGISHHFLLIFCDHKLVHIYRSCPRPGINHSFKESWFLENGV